MSKSNKSKISIEDNLLMSRATSSLKRLSQLDYNRYLEIKAGQRGKQRRKLYADLLQLMPEKENELESYFYPSLKNTKNNKFGIIKETQFQSNGIVHNIRSWGKSFIRSSDNIVYKNEIIEFVLV